MTGKSWPAWEIGRTKKGNFKLVRVFPVDLPGVYASWEGAYTLTDFYRDVEGQVLPLLMRSQLEEAKGVAGQLCARVSESMSSILQSQAPSEPFITLTGNTMRDGNPRVFPVIDEAILISLLEAYAKREATPLWVKYEYINACRWLGPRDKVLEAPETQKDVRQTARPWLQKSSQLLGQFANQCKIGRNGLTRVFDAHEEKLIDTPHQTHVLLRQTQTNSSFELLLGAGHVPAIYSLLRDWVEGYAWSVFADITYLRMYPDVSSESTSPYGIVNPGWFAWSRGHGGGLPSFYKARDELKRLLELEGSGIDKKVKEKLAERVLTGSSVATLAVVFGIATSRHDLPSSVYYDKDDFQPLIGHVQADLKKAIHSPDSPVPEALRDALLEKTVASISGKLENKEALVPPYPSNEFVVDYVDKLFSVARGKSTGQAPARTLKQTYEIYCTFVHAYPSKRFVYPFTSVLEFMVLASELDSFVNGTLQHCLEQYNIIVKTLLDQSTIPTSTS